MDWQEALVCKARPIQNTAPRLRSALHPTAATTHRPNQVQEQSEVVLDQSVFVLDTVRGFVLDDDEVMLNVLGCRLTY